jgi:hypothetical protein
VKYVDFALTGDPAAARDAAAQALGARKFEVAWTDEWTGLAERGSKVKNALLGAAAQYFKVGLRVMTGDAGGSVLRLERLSSGWMGGAIGAARTTNNMKKLRDELTQVFQGDGVLVGVTEG